MKRFRLPAVILLALLLTSCNWIPFDDDPEHKDPEETTMSAVETPPVTVVSETRKPEVSDYPLPKTASSRYGYYQLTAKEQRIYRQICHAVRQFEDRVHLAEPVSKEQIVRICELMNMEENDLYYLTDQYEYNYYQETEQVFELVLYYRFNREAVKTLNEQTEERIQEILDKVTPEMTDYQKVKLFHDEVVWGCYYWDKGDFVSTAYGALVDGKALCEGYARAFAELCNRAGIKNCFATGQAVENGVPVKHLWNMVELDGNWYHVDTTWDDPKLEFAQTGSKKREPPQIQYNYFCVTDEEVEKKIEVDRNLMTLPVADTEDYNYYRYYGLYATSFNQAENILRREIKTSYRYKSKYIYMRFSNEDLYWSFVKHYLVDEHIFDEEMTPSEYDVGRYKLWRVDDMLTIQLEAVYWDDFYK